PPELVVRTSAPRHISGLAPARTGIAAPANEIEAVDPSRPLGSAIAAAFASYDPPVAGWGPASGSRDGELVIVQATAAGRIERCRTRVLATGRLGPVAMPGEALPRLPDTVARLIATIDSASGQHMACVVAVAEGRVEFLSARRV